jgi:precorrin-3B synthase
MAAKDGLLVRLKISGGIVRAATLRAVAQAGQDYGNGLFDLSSRANLQIRGVRTACLPDLIEKLESLGLIDESAAAEAVRNVIVSPLAGLDGRSEALDAAKALEEMLASQPGLHALPAKFGFLIDDGSCLPLANVPADIRFDWVPAVNLFAIGIGGRKAEAVFLGHSKASDIADTALRLARAFLHLASQLQEMPRRMRGLIEICGAKAIAAQCGLRASPPPERAVNEGPFPVGLLQLRSAYCFGAGAAFGHVNAGMLHAAAAAAEAFGNGEIRLTPWRAMIFPLSCARESSAIRAYLAAHGFIVEREDPRLAVTACRGGLTCERSTADVRFDALSLMDPARRICSAPVALHIAGCAKGCGRQAPTDVTLIARAGLYDLIADGAALAAGLRCGTGLTAAQVRQALEGIALRAKPRSGLESQ